jgi:multiple sugar transport system substrate-binding protein
MRNARVSRVSLSLTRIAAVLLVAAWLPSAAVAQTDQASACAATTASNAMQMWERSGANSQMVNALACVWNGANPNRPINVTYIEHDQMVPKLAQALASGAPPDLLGMDLIYGPQFEAADQLTDVTDLIGNDPDLKTGSAGHMQVSTYNNRLYGVPFFVDDSYLFWNKNLFRQAGLDPETPPTNLQEIHDMAAKITALGLPGVYGFYAAGNCAGCNIFTIAPHIWASGGTIEPAKCGDEPLTGANSPAVLTWLRQMHQDGLVDPADQSENGDTFVNNFAAGKVGIMGGGNFWTVLAKQTDPNSDIGMTLIPGVQTGQVASFAGGDIVAIPKGSKRVSDAVDFEKWVLSADPQVNIYAKLGNLPTRLDQMNNQYTQASPYAAEWAAAFPVSRTPATPHFFELINSPQGPWLQMLQRVYYTDDDINAVISDTKRQMRDISCQ